MQVGTQRQPEDDQPRRSRSIDATLTPVPDERDLEQDGFDRAAGIRGDLNGLRLALRAVAEETATIDSARKQSLQGRIAELDAEVEQLVARNEAARQSTSARIQEIEARLRDLKAAVGHLEDEVRRLKTEPDRATCDFHPVKFAILTVGLAGLTLYLLAFYPSVIYTAVFSNLGEDLEKTIRTTADVRYLFNGILNPRALTDAAQNPSVLAWVLLFTCVPYGIGIATHSTIDSRWRPSRKVIALAAFLALAFLIDAVIAYRIAERIHDAQYVTGDVDVPWSGYACASDVNFWFVILLGFGAHIVWGLLLYFYVEEDRKRHPERQAIRGAATEAERLRAEIRALENERRALDDAARRQEDEFARARDERRAARERAIRELGNSVIDWNELETRLDTFTSGWIRYLVHGREATARPASAMEVLASMKADLRAWLEPAGVETAP